MAAQYVFVKKNYIAIAALIALVFALSVLSNCSDSQPLSANDFNRPPNPSTSSIIPLKRGNRWRFQRVRHAHGGRPESRDTISQSIIEVHGYIPDSGLVETNWRDSLRGLEYAYRYQWDISKGGGVILVYRDANADETPGLYTIGKYNESRDSMFDTAKLFLPYPADSGFVWITEDKDTMCVEDTDKPFYCLIDNNDSPSPLTWRNCYAYRLGQEDTVSWHYYHPDLGLMGYIRKESDAIVESYLLLSFSRF